MAESLPVIGSIENAIDWNSARCGKLLNWQNLPDPFWHYGIGLSDDKIFDTGGLRVFSRDQVKYVIGIDHIAYAPKQVIERTKHAAVAFKD